MRHAHSPSLLLLAALLPQLAASCESQPRSTVADAPPAARRAAPPREALGYPQTRREDHVDVYHGVEVPDPYRWLEDPDSEETRAWVEAQNELTFGYLEGIPERGALRARLTELWDYERFELPQQAGGRVFFRRNDGLQDQSVLFVLDAPDAEPRQLLDPNTLSEDGTVALAGWEPSDDGRWLAYGLADGGSDWNTWRVRDVATGQDLEDALEWIKFSGAAWTPDGAGFFYSRYDAPADGEELQQANYHHKLWFHRRGTPQSQDVLVYARPDHKEWGFAPTVSDDGRYLLIHVWHGTDPKNRVFYAPLPPSEQLVAGRELDVVELLDQADASYGFVGNDGPIFWFFTNLDAPRGRLVAIDTRSPARARWVELIPQRKDTLQGVGEVGGRFFASYLRDARSAVEVHDLDGRRVGSVDLPGIGTAGGFGGRHGDDATYYAFTSFTSPGTIHRLDVRSLESAVFREPKLSFDPSQYVTEQVFYRSKDGTRVPMFLVHRKGMRRDGANPTLLYGYGGFEISLTPAFSASRLAWLDAGGLYAQANLRGGGEYGEEWHRAGTLLQKQNVFDDFIAAAEHLIAERWTSSPRLAIQGGSNGGLLVGACIAQRPELFGAALPAVGVLDMLRFHKWTIGWAWVSDYGSSDDSEQFQALLAYSPYHNLRPGTCYPPTMVTTADHDDRVVPAHSFKFAAALQQAQGCDNPALIRIDVRAGHGAGKPTRKLIEQAADELAFLVRELDVALPAGYGATAPGR